MSSNEPYHEQWCVNDDNVEVDLNIINKIRDNSDLNRNILNSIYINNFDIVFENTLYHLNTEIDENEVLVNKRVIEENLLILIMS